MRMLPHIRSRLELLRLKRGRDDERGMFRATSGVGPLMHDLLGLVGCLAAPAVVMFALGTRFRQRSMPRRQVLGLWTVVSLAFCGCALVLTWQLSKSRRVQLVGDFVTRVANAGNLVALTLDDGPTPRHTEEVLNILQRHGVSATFFVTGAELAAHPSLGRTIVAAGHELGNHSFSHQRMLFRSQRFIDSEIQRTDHLIREAGHRGPIYFRPPYGKRLWSLPLYLQRANQPIMLWSIEPESQPFIAQSSKRITEHVLDQARPGSILLLHVMYDSRSTSRRALPAIIAGLRTRGLEPTPLGTVLSTQRHQQPISAPATPGAPVQ